MFKEWFSQNPAAAIFWIMAIPSSVVLVIQTLLLLFGVGGHSDAELDSDVSGIGDHDLDMQDGADAQFDANDGPFGEHDAGLRVLTVRGIVAFFAVGGWSGLSALSLGASPVVATVAAVVMGSLALYFVALFFKWALKLQENGALKPKTAVGLQGEVYIAIGAEKGSRGKVNIILQERLTELDAVSDCNRTLKYGERVRVTEVLDDNTLVVEPIE